MCTYQTVFPHKLLNPHPHACGKDPVRRLTSSFLNPPFWFIISYRPRGESDLMVAAFSKDVIDIEE